MKNERQLYFFAEFWEEFGGGSPGFGLFRFASNADSGYAKHSYVLKVLISQLNQIWSGHFMKIHHQNLW